MLGLNRWSLSSMAAALLAGAMLFCTTQNPVVLDTDGLKIRLSLDQKGMTTAQYTGSDIRAIVEFDDSVVCSFDNKKPEHIQLYTGSGRFRIPEEAILGRKLTQVEIPLYWLSKNRALLDSAGMRYDTILVEVGQQRSNTVRVNVINIAPTIDSVVVADSSCAVASNVYGNNVYRIDIDTALLVNLRIVARDADNDLLSTEWRALVHDTLLFQLSDDKRAYFRPPVFNFEDTVSVVVLDGRGGNRQVNVILQRTEGVKLLSVDSLQIGDTTIGDTAAIVEYRAARLDTVDLAAFFTNRSGTGTVSASWTAPAGLVTPLASAKTSATARYVSADSLAGRLLTTDTSRVLDTIQLTLSIDGGASISKKIVLIQVPANHPPVIDSISFDGLVSQDSQLVALAGDTVDLRLFAHDPDGSGDVTSFVWDGASSLGAVIIGTGGAVAYVVPAAGQDTLTITAVDTTLFEATRRLFVFANRPAAIDSVAVGDSTYLTTAASSDTYFHPVLATDTVALAAYATEPDADDKLSVAWTVKGGLQAAKAFTTAGFEYIAADSTYTDTATCVISDPHGFSDTAIIYFDVSR